MPVALVTGASRGIGRAAALALARKGFDVAVNYREAKDRAGSVVKELEATGRRALAVRADVSHPEQVERMFDEVESTLGPVDVLVNNAGENKVQPLVDISEPDLDRMLGVNLKGVFFCTQSAARRMTARASAAAAGPAGGAPDASRVGHIVNVASMAGVLARPGSAAYGVAKAGVVSLTLSSAEALAPHVVVNALAPGFVDTELNAYIPAERRRGISEQTPMKRFAHPDEVGETIAFLATCPAFLTGNVLRIDGGIGNVYFRA